MLASKLIKASMLLANNEATQLTLQQLAAKVFGIHSHSGAPKATFYNQKQLGAFTLVNIHPSSTVKRSQCELFEDELQQSNIQYKVHLEEGMPVYTVLMPFKKDPNSMLDAWSDVPCPVLHALAKQIITTFADKLSVEDMLVLADHAKSFPLSLAASHKRALYLANYIWSVLQPKLGFEFKKLHIRSDTDADNILIAVEGEQDAILYGICADLRRFAHMSVDNHVHIIPVLNKAKTYPQHTYGTSCVTCDEAYDLLKQLVEIK